MWLDRAQMLLAILGAALGTVMVVLGAIAFSHTGLLFIVVGLVLLANGVWFTLDAKRRMSNRRRLGPRQMQPGTFRSRSEDT